ncbi:hypothetical protein J1N35_022412 [Gossypium stocksii]|uniref:DDE Tnp4 domain-containing protein n=1 Tax=Gossypium stocksii TaxID=47602 RepID=A0A9D3VH55_9ROSI|nr:hypothetical protein J1N35_022412 [Gossypium stocksii]
MLLVVESLSAGIDSLVSLSISIETIHRYFKVVLRAILKLYKLVIRLPNESTPSEIKNNPRFYPYFKDCIEALDKTHVRESVPLIIQGRFRSCKRGTTQNVLAIITFDLKFSYVLAGWEGSAHDSRILSDALSRPRGLRISEGKYYLADAGYGIRNGYITTYRGVRYHLKEFSTQGPENANELFNLRHSSLRITIEQQEEKEEAREWSAKRNEITQTMSTDYMARNIRHTKSMNQDILLVILVLGRDMATGSFAKIFADIDLDDGNQDSVPIDCDNEETEKVRTKVSSSGISKHKRKMFKKVSSMNKLNL